MMVLSATAHQTGLATTVKFQVSHNVIRHIVAPNITPCINIYYYLLFIITLNFWNAGIINAKLMTRLMITICKLKAYSLFLYNKTKMFLQQTFSTVQHGETICSTS